MNSTAKGPGPRRELLQTRAQQSLRRRRLVNTGTLILSGIFASILLTVLAWILTETLRRGVAAYNWNFFTALPAPPGEAGGGLANAIVGTLKMIGLAVLTGVPIGVFAGVFLAEFVPGTKSAGFLRYLANILISSPSIIVGIFVYELVVLPFGGFSGYAGSVALAILIIPIITRTAEDMLLMVPRELREASLALGATRSRTILKVVFRSARNGLISSVLLAIARVSGETAPLLFTALNNPYWGNMTQPTGNLTVAIFNFAMSPYDDWQQQAWGASLLITGSVLVLTIVSRVIAAGVRRK